MSAFVLKMIAIITMTFDHAGYLIFGGSSYFNYIGRLAFPIFAFQIGEGYSHTKNQQKYLGRLFIFALISQIPFMLFSYVIHGNSVSISDIPYALYNSFRTGDFSLNIFFTLTLGLISIMIFDKIKYKSLGLLISIGIAYIAELLNTDYGFYGVAIILLFYMFKDNKIAMLSSFAIATIIKYGETIYSFYTKYIETGINLTPYINRYIIFGLCTLLPIIFISLYNGKKGRNTKFLLYFFYPLHLLLIYLSYVFTKI